MVVGIGDPGGQTPEGGDDQSAEQTAQAGGIMQVAKGFFRKFVDTETNS